MATQKIEKSMMLVKSAFGPAKSFKLIPATLNCPFVECLFSPNEKIMVVITKTMKQSYHMIPKLDDNGDEMPVKGKQRPDGKKPIKEERRLVDTFSEHYIVTQEEIINLIDTFAINPNAFDIDEFFETNHESELITPEKAPLTMKI